MRIQYLIIFITSTFLIACNSQATSTPTIVLTDTPSHPIPTASSKVPSARTPTVTPEATLTPQATSTPESTPASDSWTSLPILPEPDSNIRGVYELGQSLGNDPHSFSIFGDCQERPSDFFGVFEADPSIVENLPPELQETVANFEGSFNRESPTAQDGTTPGALLWDQWHRGEYGCSFGETPVDCELRIHNPSFVIIQIGTHFESRNTEYLRKIIGELLGRGVIPILATKADNRELDNRINRDMALLSNEFDLPLWNFWAALSDLPDHGLYVMEGREQQGAVYLNPEAQEIHRTTGLEALNIVWRYATGK